MNIICLIAGAFIPASIWGGFIAYKRCPVHFLIAAFFAAVLSILAALSFQLLLYPVIGERFAGRTEPAAVFLQSFVTAAFIEESTKAAVFALMIYFTAHIRALRRNTVQAEETSNTMLKYRGSNILFTAVFFGLLFSGFENIFYGIRYPQFNFVRLCTASALHGALGVFYILIIQEKTAQKKIGYFIKAVFLHGAYNFFAAIGGWFFILAAAVLCKTCLYPYRLKKEIREEV